MVFEINKRRINSSSIMTKHEELVSKWNECEFGVKTRVHKELGKTQVEYILGTPTYTKEENIQELIDCIKTQAESLLKDAEAMIDNINNVTA